ncbi:3-oxoacid CoA-transferase subunit A [Acinetobacter pullicarnis]|uniref:3-oxoacid CoA-transferase subunit A n=1 Tax=Acinetobacter pullicarnis TaxID=2576829 RepID=UPI0011244390|nr:3-oxoacid CoA-transferase subunit A [Acinetobacter pullicarnis]
MINKIFNSAKDIVKDIHDGATIAVGGFGGSGMPDQLIDALIEQGAKDLTIVSNNAGNGDQGLAALLKAHQVRKLICSFPRQKDAYVFEDLYRNKAIELEIVPQGTLAERLRAAGCGIGGFYTRTGYGTLLSENKETKQIDGKNYIFEKALAVDYALIYAKTSDRWGNLIYNKAARNFAPVMAMAAKTTIVAVDQICELGDLDPEIIITPGIFVDRVILKTTSGANS